MDILVRIKKLVLEDFVRYTAKAVMEMDSDGLTELDVKEAIVSANSLRKVVRSTSSRRIREKEKLYIIVGVNFGGIPIYTKGTIRKGLDHKEYLYIFISSKRCQ